MRFTIYALLAACSSPGGSNPDDVTRQYVDAVEARDLDRLFELFHPDNNEIDGELLESEDLFFSLLEPRAAAVEALLDDGTEFALSDRGQHRGDRFARLDYDCDPDTCTYEAVRVDGRWYVGDVD